MIRDATKTESQKSRVLLVHRCNPYHRQSMILMAVQASSVFA